MVIYTVPCTARNQDVCGQTCAPFYHYVSETADDYDELNLQLLNSMQTCTFQNRQSGSCIDSKCIFITPNGEKLLSNEYCDENSDCKTNIQNCYCNYESENSGEPDVNLDVACGTPGASQCTTRLCPTTYTPISSDGNYGTTFTITDGSREGRTCAMLEEKRGDCIDIDNNMQGDHCVYVNSAGVQYTTLMTCDLNSPCAIVNNQECLCAYTPDQATDERYDIPCGAPSAP
jgi:hypothetical protein